VTEPISVFYVDDSLNDGDEYTPGAVGDDANDGLSALTPKASIRSVLETYNLGSGDVILVDTGVYEVGVNIVITSADAGVEIRGPELDGHTALLDRGNTTSGSYVIKLSNADDVILSNLSITGGQYGIFASSSSDSDNVVIRDSEIFGNNNHNVYFQASNDQAVLENNRMHSVQWNSGSGALLQGAGTQVLGGVYFNNKRDGLQVSGEGALIEGVEAFGNSVGIRITGSNTANAEQSIVRNNQTHDNSSTGINASTNVLVVDNTVYGQSGTGDLGIDIFRAIAQGNEVYNNYNGIRQSTSTVVRNNIVYFNSNWGISTTTSSALVENNQIYSNAIGLWLSAGTTNSSNQANNNVIYANSTSAVVLERGQQRFFNNTVDQVGGTAVLVQGGAKNIQIYGNILRVEDAVGLDVADNSQVSFKSDYNIFELLGSSVLARWSGVDFDNRTDWVFEVGRDEHSLVTDPLFVNPAGADGVLGYSAVLEGDFGADDDYHLQAGSPGIDRGHPLHYYLAEPDANGGRVNVGAYGNTVEATTSPVQLVQILSPNGLEKFEAGQETSIQWRSSGLTETHTLALINAGGLTVQGGSQGDWLANDYQTLLGNSTTFTLAVDTGSVVNPAPETVYQQYAYASNGVGKGIAWELPVVDGDYTVRLHFFEPNFTTAGTRVFDINLQGATVLADFSIVSAAGDRYTAVTRSFDVSAMAGEGIKLELMNLTNNGAVLSGIEITQANAAGGANPTVDLELLTDNGDSPIVSGLPMDRFGRGEYLWTANLETVGNDAFILATENVDGSPQDSSDEGFLIANTGTNYYVNDSNLIGDEYTTVVGNNARPADCRPPVRSSTRAPRPDILSSR